MRSASPRSARICCSSVFMFGASCESMVTERSMPTVRCLPDRSFGRSLVPNRFHTSEGKGPASRRVVSEGVGGGGGLVAGLGSGPGPGLGENLGCGLVESSGLALRGLALALVRRKTSGSNATSVGAISSPYQTRSGSSGFRVDEGAGGRGVRGSKATVEPCVTRTCTRGF